MAKARSSGITVHTADVPLILAMVARKDRRHDIAAWFGLNQGRIREVEKGEHGTPPLASTADLPPSGSPGPKARSLRRAVREARKLLDQNNPEAAKTLLDDATEFFDMDE